MDEQKAPIGISNLILCSSLTLLLYRLSISDVINALEGGDDFFVMGHDDDGCLRLLSHIVENAHHAECALAVQWSSGFIGQNYWRFVGQGTGN